MGNQIISLKEIEFSYPKGKFTFHCASADFYPGEVTLITGPNGSGKTTLSKLMCGILRPTKGGLFLNGEPANDWPLGKIGKTVGYLFQEPSQQLFTATVWEEMTFIDQINGIDPIETEKKASALLASFGLSAYRDNNTFRLSRGEKQRLALCAILMQSSKFLILDEPTTGLDRVNRAFLYETVDRLCAEGIGFAIISHDREVKERYHERKIEVAGGCVYMKTLDPRLKLLSVMIVTTFALVYKNPLWMLGLAAVSFFMSLLLGANTKSFFYRFRKFIGLLFTITVVQCIFIRTGPPLIQINGFVLITADGVSRAATAALRYFILLCSASVMAGENSRRVIAGLTQIGVPYMFAFMMMTALRFIPEFGAVFADALVSIQLRGVELKKVPLGRKLRLYGYLLLPVTADAVVKSQDLAIAMEARGFGAQKKRTSYLRLKMERKDWTALAVIVIITLATTYLTVLYR